MSLLQRGDLKTCNIHSVLQPPTILLRVLLQLGQGGVADGQERLVISEKLRVYLYIPNLDCTHLAFVKVKGVLTGPLLRRMLVVRYLVKRKQIISKERAEI